MNIIKFNGLKIYLKYFIHKYCINFKLTRRIELGLACPVVR